MPSKMLISELSLRTLNALGCYVDVKHSEDDVTGSQNGE